ncbi:C40 family peptidase [Dactylosporangium cerinum]|uniref:C40 family peptidase n=1 Tax=Dactylosporangium cerinum TaxID=1434730 RepID=A0ABV9VJ49_9ACTN
MEHETTGHRARVSTTAPPAGVHSLAYYRGTMVDERAELREIRAASRDAMRARIALAGAANQPGGTAPPAGANQVEGAGTTSATAAGAAAARTGKRARPAPKADRARPATTRTGPGRQRTSTARATPPRKAARATPRTAAPRIPTPRFTAPAGGNGGGFADGGGGVVGFALAQVGKGYGYGSVGPDRFDCSGLVAAAYRRVGISLPHQTGALAAVGRSVGRGELRPGDLVFPAAGHVGIYIGGGRMVHASTERGGVKISPIYAFSFARRVA